MLFVMQAPQKQAPCFLISNLTFDILESEANKRSEYKKLNFLKP